MMKKPKSTIRSLREKYLFDPEKGITQKNHILLLFHQSRCQLTSVEITAITDIKASTVTPRLTELEAENKITLLSYRTMYDHKYKAYGFNYEPDVVPLHLKSDFELLMQAVKSTLWNDDQKNLIIEEYGRLKNYKKQIKSIKKGQTGLLSA